MPRRKKVKDLPDFEKEESSQAVINTNSDMFVQRREQMAILANKEDKISQLEKDVQELKKLVKGLSK